MPQHSYFTQIAAGAQDSNIMEGTPYINLTHNAVLRIYGCAATVGAGEGRVDAMIGERNLTTPEGAVLPLIATIGQGPDKNRHKLLEEVVPGGQPLVIRVRNTAAAAALDPCIIIDLTWF